MLEPKSEMGLSRLFFSLSYVVAVKVKEKLPFKFSMMFYYSESVWLI